LSEHDPKGWAQWYKRYAGGRRLPGEDERQIKRWLSLKARHGGPFVTKPTPKRGWALRNWAVDPAKLVPDQAQAINSMLEEHQRKAMQKFVQERVQAPVKAAELAPDVQLQEHQQRVSDRISDDDPRLLLYHGLGTGKSLSAIAAAEAAKKVHGGEYGVVVPASLKPNFQKEVKKFTRNSNPEILSYTGLALGKNFQNMPETLVMDEAQRLKNPGSATSSAARRLAARAKRLLLLSGTPITNSPGDLASPVSMLRNETISPQEFEKQFVGYKKKFPGIIPALRGAQWGEVPYVKNEDRLRTMLRGMVDYQPGKTPDGVSVNEETIKVPLSAEQQKIQKAVRSGIPPGFLWKLDQEFPLSREELSKLNSFMTGLRQVSLSTQPFRADKNPLKAFDQSSKLQEAMKRLRETLDSDPRRKAIIYSNFIDAGLKPYAAALERENIPHGIFHGGIPLAARQQALNDYNAGKLRALLLGPAAAEGISTKGTSLIQLMDPYWHESRTQQARGRGLRFDSHQGLPDELKNVAVQRYLSGSEEPGLLGKLMGKRRQRTGDEVMSRLADEKEQLNEKFRQILRDVGTARAQEKAAAGVPAPPKKKKPGMPWLSAGLGGVGALGLGAAYGMASDQHAQSMRNALALHGTPLQPGETSLSRYGEILSPGANSTPFGLSIGNILSTARQYPETLKRFGINADPADKPGSFIDAEMHYDQFRKGPISAYYHMTHPNKMMGEAKYNVGDKSYPEFMRGHFNNAWRQFIHPQTGVEEMRGNAGWLEPHEIDTQKIPYDKQVQFMHDYEKTLPPEVQKIRQGAESHPDATAGLEKNLQTYMQVMRHALDARDKLKHIGLAAGGAGAGGALGHYLMRNRKDKNPLGYWASVLGGTGLGGAAGYYGGTAQGQQQMAGLIEQLKALANRA
jgi:superfamily II DNA or RNA helicase